MLIRLPVNFIHSPHPFVSLALPSSSTGFHPIPFHPTHSLAAFSCSCQAVATQAERSSQHVTAAAAAAAAALIIIIHIHILSHHQSIKTGSPTLTHTSLGIEHGTTT